MISDVHPEGFAFWSGLAMGLLGLLLWMIADIHAATTETTLWSLEAARVAAQWLGLGAAVAGPLWYWVLRPGLWHWRAPPSSETGQ